MKLLFLVHLYHQEYYFIESRLICYMNVILSLIKNPNQAVREMAREKVELALYTIMQAYLQRAV